MLGHFTQVDLIRSHYAAAPVPSPPPAGTAGRCPREAHDRRTQHTERTQAWHVAHASLCSSLTPDCKYEVSVRSNNKLKRTPCHGSLNFFVFSEGAFSQFDTRSTKKLFP